MIGVLIWPTALAEPTIRVVSFEADWCPVCQITVPRLERAIRKSDQERIVLSAFDFSDTDPATAIDRRTLQKDLAAQWKVESIFAAYGDRTGFAVIAAIDSGEVLGCISSRLDHNRIADRLELAIRMTAQTPIGARKPFGKDCPDIHEDPTRF